MNIKIKSSLINLIKIGNSGQNDCRQNDLNKMPVDKMTKSNAFLNYCRKMTVFSSCGRNAYTKWLYKMTIQNDYTKWLYKMTRQND